MNTPLSTPNGPFVVVKNGQREGKTFANLSEAEAAAQQMRSLLESRPDAKQSPAKVEVKQHIQG